MAGYIMSIGGEKDEGIKRIGRMIYDGVYSTTMLEPVYTKKWGKPTWNISHEGTFADYITMKPGDNIYFFCKRKIYGVGELVEIKGDCKYKNYPEAGDPAVNSADADKTDFLYSCRRNIPDRWICTFIPSPYFFRKGIDMDEALSSSPASFKMLRAFWKKSFIKIDETENKALKDAILKYNQSSIHNPKTELVFPYNSLAHRLINKKLANNPLRIKEYKLNSLEIIQGSVEGKKIAHEMAIEGYLLERMDGENKSPFILGKWDYISHQVVASPQKPVDYMDAIDIFGYKYLNGTKTVYKYSVTEIKSGTAQSGDLNQLMKYVDWIAREYANGDYSMIEAILVAKNYEEGIIAHKKKAGKRQYVKGNRPVISSEWKSIRLCQYEYNEDKEEINIYELK